MPLHLKLKKHAAHGKRPKVPKPPPTRKRFFLNCVLLAVGAGVCAWWYQRHMRYYLDAAFLVGGVISLSGVGNAAWTWIV